MPSIMKKEYFWRLIFHANYSDVVLILKKLNKMVDELPVDFKCEMINYIRLNKHYLQEGMEPWYVHIVLMVAANIKCKKSHKKAQFDCKTCQKYGRAYLLALAVLERKTGDPGKL